MRRLTFFVGLAAGIFLVWYYLNSQQRQKAQPAPQEERSPSPAQAEPEPQVEGYCVRCKGRRVMQSPYATTTKTGRPAIRGTCPVCGARMFKMGQM